ncbi:MAG: hypothetical protein KIH08_12785 [Candidatus Freyarchaeota archaeon]|nr:hypothetical protein [Candidatus Jordarchaeia archaeon]
MEAEVNPEVWGNEGQTTLTFFEPAEVKFRRTGDNIHIQKSGRMLCLNPYYVRNLTNLTSLEKTTICFKVAPTKLKEKVKLGYQRKVKKLKQTQISQPIGIDKSQPVKTIAQTQISQPATIEKTQTIQQNP